jgi:hypothetical protein
MIERLILIGIIMFGLVLLRLLAIAVENSDKSHAFVNE